MRVGASLRVGVLGFCVGFQCKWDCEEGKLAGSGTGDCSAKGGRRTWAGLEPCVLDYIHNSLDGSCAWRRFSLKMKQLAEASLTSWAVSHEIQPRSSQNKLNLLPGT